MIRINDIQKKAVAHNPRANQALIDQAYIYSAKAHAGQIRLSGEPYLSHPLEVALILADMGLDEESIAAGLLHDIVEDKEEISEADIGKVFGENVQRIVSGVTKLSKLPFKDARVRQAESIRKMILAMADDLRVILIKLADRIHNMRTLKYHNKESKKKKISQETLDIYAPIAARLGIYWMKDELENTAFFYIDPSEYRRIEDLVNTARSEQEKYIESIRGNIETTLNENRLSGEVSGRFKTIFSIYRKMRQQDLSFEDVYDIIAFRIILDTTGQCYATLGVLHALWKPIDIKFKDYIAHPKPNGYQSLHTTVIGPRGKRVELQIRTREMDVVAQSGVAAHWSYKEGIRIGEKDSQAFAWIQNLVEHQKHTLDPKELLENVRIDLFPDEVHVFTPQGDVKILPAGATPVDFAFLIHTEVGLQCKGAKVNDRMVPLDHELHNGDVVQIITRKNQHPSRNWLAFVKTVKARSRIRHWVKTQETERSLSLGRELCEKEFRKHRLNFNALSKKPKMEKIAARFGFKDLESLIINVGYGKITPLQIVRRLLPKETEKKTAADDQTKSRDPASDPEMVSRKPREGILVRGVEDVLIRFGKCCQPVPGDEIVGYISVGKGVTVHRNDCVNARKLNPERQVDVTWGETEEADTYPVRICIRSKDRVGLMADIAAAISKEGINIRNVNSRTHENLMTVDTFCTLSVRNTSQLDHVFSILRKVPQVIDVRRIS